MRHLREIGKIAPITCKHIDQSYCLKHKCWCYAMSNCETKGGVELPKEIRIIKRVTREEAQVIGAVANAYKVVPVEEIEALSKRFERTEASIKTIIARCRKGDFTKGARYAKDNQSKQESYTEICT